MKNDLQKAGETNVENGKKNKPTFEDFMYENGSNIINTVVNAQARIVEAREKRDVAFKKLERDEKILDNDLRQWYKRALRTVV